jgi:hypothetical protein
MSKICPFMSRPHRSNLGQTVDDLFSIVYCREDQCMAWIPAKLKIGNVQEEYQPGYCKLIGVVG